MADVIYTFRDAAGKTSSLRVPIDTPATNEAGFRTLLAALSIGQLARVTIIDSTQTVSEANAASDQAFVGDGVRIYFTDNVTGEEHFVTLPMPDMSDFVMVPGGNGAIDLTQPVAVTNFITDFNADARSPAGNAVTIQSMKRVSRSR